MTELLKRAFERAEQLPEKEQNALAVHILDIIKTQEWKQIHEALLTSLLDEINENRQIANEPQLQEKLRILVLDAIDELEWEQISSKTRTQDKLLYLANTALEEHKSGKTEEGGFAL